MALGNAKQAPRTRYALGALVLSLSLLAACLDGQVVECADRRLCPAGLACDDAHKSCVLPEQVSSCVNKPDGNDCKYRGVPHGACYEHVCLPAGCGNGILDPGEGCDDANRVHGDGCSADCRSNETCGNGIIDITVGESCEPGVDGEAWCRDDCVSARCGDGVIDDAFEVCDLGSANSDEPDAPCRPNCQLLRCGDGIQDTGEVCDDGNARSSDGCASDCLSDETCGNGIVDATVGESCEPTASNDGWCRDDCVSVTCGDGVLDSSAFEQCDDGTNNSATPDAVCRPNCQRRRCGDGITDSDETCDDGNQSDGDGCSHDCKSLEWCGNRYVDARKGEQCDDGNSVSHDGCSSRCREEAPEWRSLDIIPFYISSSLGYDAMRDVAVVSSFSRTYELSGTGWRQQDPRHLPQVSYDPGMAWDSARRRVVAFGGKDANGIDVRGTWEWDGADWELRVPRTTTPEARYMPTMTYDPVRDRTVMFGGTIETLTSEVPHPAEWQTETWEWDGSDWTRVATIGSPPEGNYAATFDPVQGRVVAFDGTALWTLDAGTWTSRAAPISDSPRRARSLTFDANRKRLVTLLVDRSAGRTTLHEWDGSAWLSMPMPASDVHAVVYRAARRRLTLLSLNETWEWNGRDWDMVGSSQKPTKCLASSLTYDPFRGRTILFSGMNEQSSSVSTPLFSQVWLWDGSSWLRGTSTSSPPPRSSYAATYDPGARQLVVFGGTAAGTDGTDLGDTWLWDGTDWTRASTSPSPSARSNGAMTYDVARREIVLFGGGVWPGAQGDTWTWDGHTWSVHTVMPAPAARTSHVLSYDPIRREALLTIGDTVPYENESSTWAWNGSNWRDIGVPKLSYRGGASAAYDANHRNTLIVGGGFVDNVHTLALPAQPSAELAVPWQPLPIPFSRDPSVQRQRAVYDPLNGRTLALVASDEPMWELSYRAEGELYEVCQYGFDVDGDGLIGCADPDCWGYCTPMCPPGAECDESFPHCGDGECNTALETCRLCPEDCACEALCGDFFCDAGESAESCPGDCARPAPSSP